MAKKRILTVGDHPDITLTVKAGLEASGLFEVYTFSDPEVALASFRPGQYDLALLDFRMPKINGYKLSGEMKKVDSNLKICFMTGIFENMKNYKLHFQQWR